MSDMNFIQLNKKREFYLILSEFLILTCFLACSPCQKKIRKSLDFLSQKGIVFFFFFLTDPQIVSGTYIQRFILVPLVSFISTFLYFTSLLQMRISD